MIFLIVNAALLLLISGFLAFSIARNINFKAVISTGIDKLNSGYRERMLQHEVKKYTRSVSIKMTLIEKVELLLIDKSNIRSVPLIGKFISFYTLIGLCVLIFIATFEPVYRILFFPASTTIICLLFSVIPFFLLDLLARYNSDLVRKRLANFISVLNRWCAVKEDIFYAFEKSIESGIGEPLKTFIRDMVIQVSRGINPLEALEILRLKVDNPQFSDFIVNIKQNIKASGDIRKLLTNLENQFYKIDEEYSRRKISTYKDRLIIYAAMFFVIVLAYFFLNTNDKARLFYLGTAAGKWLLTLFCCFYATGIYLTTKITEFKY